MLFRSNERMAVLVAAKQCKARSDLLVQGKTGSSSPSGGVTGGTSKSLSAPGEEYFLGIMGQQPSPCNVPCFLRRGLQLFIKSLHLHREESKYSCVGFYR